MTLNDTDKTLLKEKGITEEKLLEQLRMLSEGFPYLKIEAPATVGNGITLPTPELEAQCIEIWEKYLHSG
ncbi:MAG: DUF4301 family protein, partial [Muribaculaceae bacterium]|nr:DUF4301 family protein [Muribaculaceae bacterium]